MELRHLARTCDFGQFLEEALRDRLVCGLNSGSIQKKLLSENDLTLQRAIDIATAAEMVVLQPSDQLPRQTEAEVLALQEVCKCCGKQGHSLGVCRFRTRVCYQFGIKGHLRSVCPGEPAKPNKSLDGKRPQAVKQVAEHQPDQDNNDDFTL